MIVPILFPYFSLLAPLYDVLFRFVKLLKCRHHRRNFFGTPSQVLFLMDDKYGQTTKLVIFTNLLGGLSAYLIHNLSQGTDPLRNSHQGGFHGTYH